MAYYPPYPPPAGRVLVSSAEHPTSAQANSEVPWRLVGAVTGGPVENPAVAYRYLDGPSPYVLVLLATKSAIVWKGGAWVGYLPGT